MKPVITSAMLRKRRIPRDSAPTDPQKDVREPRNDDADVEPTNEHPAFRAPQLGLKTALIKNKRESRALSRPAS